MNSEDDILLKPDIGISDGFFCVGIGASAGGLEAIETFFRSMPENPGLSFVIVQHLSPDYKSLMSELLSRHTSLPIYVAEDGMPIEKNVVYLIPPKKNMTMFGRRLFLTDHSSHKGLNLPIDIFFRSLALDMGDHSIGVVLSGTGSDGALGIRAIKEAGGMIMVQDSDSAKFDGMPRSSLATGVVDFVLSPDQMPLTLLKYVKHPLILQSEAARTEISNDNALLRILRVIRDVTTVDFTYYKPNTILRRLEKRLGINQIGNFKDYLDFLSTSPREVHALYKDLLIGVTQFFRDSEAFDLVAGSLLPSILDKKPEGGVVRIWCAGCSTGEEAYSLAILVTEYIEKTGKNLDVKLFATDIDKEHIEIASAGSYPESIVTDVSPERLEKYFIVKSEGYQVNDKLRRMVIFARQNIIKDPPFSKMDLISCRNMLIYLGQEMQRKIISMFYYSLVPGGGLFLGSSESLGDMAPGFDVVNNKWKVFRQKQGYKPALAANYLLPLSPKPRQSRKQDFGYLEIKQGNLSDNVLTDLLEQVMPPSVLVNEEFQVLHIFRDVSEYVRIGAGKASLNLLDMMKKELSVVVSSMLHKALADGKEVVFRDIRINNHSELIDLAVRPLADKFSKKQFLVVSFVKLIPQKNVGAGEESFNLQDQINTRYNELEKELQFTRENLQATIEELETSNEELQSTNEELVASNEELQSTNEELQSVNEELYTVNSEYQRKIEELTELNNDMNNLLKNTQIGMLYLDKNLKIRKFTQMVTRIIPIMEMDTGRPIHHISLNVNYPSFIEDIEQVQATLVPCEKEIADRNGNWNLVKILPYRTSDNAIEGIALTVIDITKLKKSQQQAASLDEKLDLALSMGNLAWWEWDYSTGLISASSQRATMLGFPPEEFENETFDRWCSRIHAEDLPAFQRTIERHIGGQQPVSEAEYRVKTSDGSWKWLYYKGGATSHDQTGAPKRLSGILFDISQSKSRELEIVRNRDLLYRILENSPTGKLLLNSQGQITWANTMAENIFGLIREGNTWSQPHCNFFDQDDQPIPDDKLPFHLLMNGIGFVSGYYSTIVLEDGTRRQMVINGSPIFNESGDISGAVITYMPIAREEIKNYKSWKTFI